MNEEELEPWLAEAARDYHRPDQPPRDAIWRGIDAARQRPIADPRLFFLLLQILRLQERIEERHVLAILRNRIDAFAGAVPLVGHRHFRRQGQGGAVGLGAGARGQDQDAEGHQDPALDRAGR